MARNIDASSSPTTGVAPGAGRGERRASLAATPDGGRWLLRSIVLLFVLLPGRSIAAPAGTLDRLVDGLNSKVGSSLDRQEPRRLDLSFAIRPGPGVPPKLVKVVADLLASRLTGRSFRRVEQIPSAAKAAGTIRQARTMGFERLLELELAVVEGYLHLRGAMIATDRQLWRDTLRPRRGSSHHLHASVRVDAEVRSFMGAAAAKPLRFAPRSHPLPWGRVLDLAVGDLDGDGRGELVVLHPRALEVLRFQGGVTGFKRILHHRLAPPFFPVMPRRSVGALVVVDTDRDGKAEILVRTSEMARGGTFQQRGNKLLRRGDLDGYPLASAMRSGDKAAALTCMLVTGQDLFDLSTLKPKLPQAMMKNMAATFYDMKGVVVPGRTPRRFLGQIDGAGQLRVFEGDSANFVLFQQGVGLAFDLVDVNDDGALEVVLTSPAAPFTTDRIKIQTIGSGARVMWQSQILKGSVTALTHGDINGNGRQELIAAVEDRRGKVTLELLN